MIPLESFLFGLSCPSASYCIAIDSTDDVDQNRLLTWSGGKWTAVRAPLPANARGSYQRLDGVSCPSISHCVAVGTYATGETGATQEGLLLTVPS